jgi:muramoyltetrapeptide carboxypeptidase LdcA involved in peptidoglycan recycling
MGYSDITALLLAIYKCSNLAAYHGPVGSSKFTDNHKTNIENIFFNKNEIIKYKI